MLVLSLFSWWYGRGWAQVAQSLKPRLQSIAANFSVNQLRRTLFAPWRKIITYPGASLQAKMRAWGDNLFSRIIGFIIRISVLLAAGCGAIGVCLVTLLEIIIWPIIPLAVPGCLIAGLLL